MESFLALVSSDEAVLRQKDPHAGECTIFFRSVLRGLRRILGESHIGGEIANSREANAHIITRLFHGRYRKMDCSYTAVREVFLSIPHSSSNVLHQKILEEKGNAQAELNSCCSQQSVRMTTSNDAAAQAALQIDAVQLRRPT